MFFPYHIENAQNSTIYIILGLKISQNTAVMVWPLTQFKELHLVQCNMIGLECFSKPWVIWHIFWCMFPLYFLFKYMLQGLLGIMPKADSYLKDHFIQYQMALSHLAGSTLCPRIECYLSMFVLCPVIIRQMCLC